MDYSRFLKSGFITLNLLSVIFLGGCSTQAPSNVVTINSASWTATPTEVQLVRSLVEEFEKRHPNIRVKHDVVTGDYASKIMTQLAGGGAPDAFWADMTFIRPLVSKNAIADLTPYINTDKVDTDDFYPSLLEPFVVENHFYGLPNDACTLALFYNKDLFDKAHLSYPDDKWTWDDLLKAAIKLTIVKDKSEVVDQWGIILPRRPDFWFEFIYQNGGRVFEEKDPNKLLLTQPPALEAMKFYTDVALKYHASPSHGQASDLDISKGFQLGKAAMMISGWWDMVDTDKNAPKLRYGVVPLPKHEFRATVNLATATVMSKGTKHPKETWEFIKFMTGKEGQIVRCKSGMAGPSRKSVAADPYFNGKNNEKVFIDGFDYGKAFYGNYTNLIIDEFGRAYERILLGQQSVDQAFQEANQNYEKRKNAN
jgi:multiple sugar transport system substrate-binding protein